MVDKAAVLLCSLPGLRSCCRRINHLPAWTAYKLIFLHCWSKQFWYFILQPQQSFPSLLLSLIFNERLRFIDNGVCI
jgi:hypothetical protein